MAKKTAEVEVDEIETLDEEVEATEAAPAKAKKARKAKVEKPVLEGMTSKEAAAVLGITPVKLRRILRSDDFYPDKNYTRYALTDEVIDRVKAAIAAGTAATTKKPRGKKVKAAVVETASEDIAEELDSLDDLASDEDAEEVDIDEDEDEDE